MNTNNALNERPVLSSCVQLSLNQALGGPFIPWQRHVDGWKLRSGSAGSSGLNASRLNQLSAWFDVLLKNLQCTPQTLSIDETCTYVAVVTEAEDGQLEIVAGQVSLDRDQLIEVAATAATHQFSQLSQQQLLEDYAGRLAASYEELTFLRRFSQHIEYCVADHSLDDVAEEILPRLRGILSVEALCLIGAATHDDGVKASRVVGCDGVLPESKAYWCDFIARLGDANRRSIVRNFRGIQRRFPITVPPSCRSIALVPIEKDGHIYGWLLAINKYVASHSVCALGANELGSMEASLLEAAASMLGAQASNNRLFDEKESMIVEVIHTLVGVIESRDSYTCGHSDRVALYAQIIATELGLPDEQCQDLFLSGLLHDIGKVGVPDDVLLKPTALSAEEFSLIKKHPEIGARLLNGIKALEKLIPGVLHHHEAVDGSGYPHGLRGDEIPMMARILAVADAYDAMTSSRPYRNGMTVEKASLILENGAGKQWDANIVAAFMSARSKIIVVGNSWQDHLDKLLNHRLQQTTGRQSLNTADFVAEFSSLSFNTASNDLASL